VTSAFAFALALVTAAAPVPGQAPALTTLDPASSALLAKEAERIGLAKRPETARRLDRERKRLATELYLREKAKAAVPTDAEALAAVHAGADAAKVQVVVLGTRQEAQGALDRLRRGGSLAEEAKASIEPGTRLKAGEVGWLQRGALPPAVVADAFSGSLESWGGPYEVEGRWFVVRVTDRRIADAKAEAAGLEKARAALLKEREAAARAAHVAGLRDRAKVKIDDAFLRSAAEQGGARGADRDHVVATIGARKLRCGEVLDSLEPVGGHGGAARSPAMLSAAASQLVDRIVLEQAAVKEKYDKRPEVEKALATVRERVLVASYYDDVAARLPVPTPAEIEARYRERAKEFEVPASRRCAHVLAASEEDARRLRGRIAGGEPFDAVARAASLDKESGSRGGGLGEVPEARLQRMEPALASAIRTLPDGVISEPVRSGMGWHLVRCELIPARVQALPEVQDRITAALRHERVVAAVNARVAELTAGKSGGGRP
jgi:parvulin-like peptidyl-prolyl isomerase